VTTTKSHLLCPWVLDIAEDPYVLDIFGDLIGPNIRCWRNTEIALANWSRVVGARAKLFFEDSRYGPSEAYGGTRPAT
jgi:hypothetical protein